MPQVIAQMIAAILLMIGLGTPFAGTIIAGMELWIVFSGSADTWIAIMLIGLAASLAMIGPGAWSVDARLFGRKHIEFRKGSEF